MRTLGHVVTFKNYFTMIYYENAGPVYEHLRIVLLFVLIIIFHSLFRWLFFKSDFACHFSSINFLFF